MNCPQCRAETREGLKFCEDCGARLALACPSCGAEITSGKRFCGECGARIVAGPPSRQFPSPESYTPKHLAEKILTSKSALEGERKQVTVLFADLKGSMELLADRDPEEARKILDPVLEGTFAVHAATWGKSRESSRRRTDSPIQLWEPVTLHERTGRQSILFDTVRRGT